MRAREVNPVLYALWISSYASCQLAHILPRTDLTTELLDLLLEQCEIIDDIIDQSDFEKDNIENFIDDCEKIIRQVERIETK